MMIRYLLRFGIPVALLLIALWLSSSTANDAAPASQDSLRRVRVLPVETADQVRQSRFSGTLRAAKRADLGFAAGGRLLARPVDTGAVVEAGQTLARLDTAEFRHRLDGAEASLREREAGRLRAAQALKRVERLREAKAATEEEWELAVSGDGAAEAALQAARAARDEAARMLRETELTAPFAARVEKVMVEPGEWVTPGRPVFVLSGLGALEVEVQVPETLIGRLREGQVARVELPFAGGPGYRATLIAIGRSSGAHGGLFPVVARLQEPGAALAGMTAEVLLSVSLGPMSSVPIAAVVNPGGGQPAVYRVRASLVERLPVDVSRLMGDRIMVTGALEPGDLVVTAGHAGLLDGERVEVAP